MEITHTPNNQWQLEEVPSRQFVIGDIHGAHKALLQCLQRASFDYEKDILISLGDLCDGWPETVEVIEELKKIKDFLLVKGNHDLWLEEYLNFGLQPDIWTMQGGQATIDSYLKNPDALKLHRDFFKQAAKCFVDDKNRIFCHGGFERGIDIKVQLLEKLMWDRTLATKAAGEKADSLFQVHEYKKVFLGHTTVNSFKKLARNKPHWGGNVCLMDTGAGWEGVLTIMDVDSEEYWQSDVVADLYPNHRGRG